MYWVDFDGVGVASEIYIQMQTDLNVTIPVN